MVRLDLLDSNAGTERRHVAGQVLVASGHVMGVGHHHRPVSADSGHGQRRAGPDVVGCWRPRQAWGVVTENLFPGRVRPSAMAQPNRVADSISVTIGASGRGGVTGSGAGREWPDRMASRRGSNRDRLSWR